MKTLFTYCRKMPSYNYLQQRNQDAATANTNHLQATIWLPLRTLQPSNNVNEFQKSCCIHCCCWTRCKCPPPVVPNIISICQKYLEEGQSNPRIFQEYCQGLIWESVKVMWGNARAIWGRIWSIQEDVDGTVYTPEVKKVLLNSNVIC